MTRSLHCVISIAAIAIATSAAADVVDPTELALRLAESTRSDAEKARDAGRKPAEVLAFLGIEPGMAVMDVIAAGGYYTEVLSIAVGPSGKVYAQNPDFVLKVRDGANDKAMTARLAADRLPNVVRVDGELGEIAVPDASLGAAITALNFHDVFNGRGKEAALAFLAGIYAKLEPGGVLGIIDHEGIAGQDNEKLHRLEKQRVLDVIAMSEFTLEAESDLLSNRSDDHTQFVFDAGIRGETDRYLLRLRKPRT